MGRFCLEDSIKTTFIKFANGNIGAFTALMELRNSISPSYQYCCLGNDMATLDKMGLYEDKLYMLWNDCCNRDINKMKLILEKYREGAITDKDIEERIKNVGYGKKFDDLLEVKLC